MGALKTFTRRAFLIGSAAIAGGVAFGVYRYHNRENPLNADLGAGEAAITPYIKITDQGITLYVPRADKGQGAYSVQAALIAEELDIALDDVTIEASPPSPVYANQALAQDVVPFPATNEGFVAESARAVVGTAISVLGLQITGGSSTVPDSYEKLRHAGAVARQTLKQAAAEMTGTPLEALSTENGHVILPDGQKLAYGALAAQAANIAPVQEITLRDPATWRILGKPMVRADMVAKSTGTQLYGIDIQREDMLYGAVKMNPRIGAAMLSFDAEAARAMRGVEQIVPLEGGVGVLADNSWRAFQAADAIECAWAEAPYPASMDGHWQILSESFTPERTDKVWHDAGDIDSLTSPFEAEYKAPYLAHQPLEPANAKVLVAEDRVDVWAGTQVPDFAIRNIAAITGLDASAIHIHVQMMGGSFGQRLEDDVIRQATHLAMAVRGRPVKLTYKREEDFTHDYMRQIAMARGRGTVTNGQVSHFDLSIAMPSVTASQFSRQGLPAAGPDSQIVAGAWGQPFAIPNYRITGYRAPELAPISSWRSVGASSNGFFHDCFLDELIHAAGADPMDERIRLCNHAPSRAVLEAVRAMSGWDGPKMGPNRGRGVAFCLSFGVPCAEVIEVTQTPSGIRIDKVYVAADVGTILDPVNFENNVQGGVIWGLGHAINTEITFEDGMVQQDNFYAAEGLRLNQCPEIIVKGLENGTKIRGIGEPPVPPAAAALANAIFAATGQRIREMPFNKHIDFA